MPTIAIVDDRTSDRETICKVVKSTLKRMNETKTWQVIADAPPLDQEDVIPWLDENDATVLVTDWRLNEGAQSQRVVNYAADTLIGVIRARRPTFPIFIITGYENEARTHLKDVENIFSRKEFTKNAEDVVPQMIRSGLRRYGEQKELLTRIDVLSRKLAKGEASLKERSEMESLSGYFQSELPSMIKLEEVLAEFETVQKRANKLRQRIQQRIDREKDDKRG